MKKNIALIGLGPHAKRIYIKYLKEHDVTLKLLVELESHKETSKQFLIENGFKDIEIMTIPDEYKDNEQLPINYEKELLNILKKLKITHMIISTEPKAHNMYLLFALKNNINVLSDKPITVMKGMNKIENIEKIRSQYYDLLNIYNRNTAQCKIMCQRLYHRGYSYIKQLLTDIIKTYNIPITYIDIYHCDGNWEMPHDLDKENHPYKYGYGKLYHSGFHFIDLLSELLKINNYTTSNKHIKSGKLYGNIFTPNDEKTVFNSTDFKKIFPQTINKTIYNNLENINFNNYGEKNFYSQLNFYNNDKNLITTANLNLLHYGFSRRGWLESKDFYKKNGRVRHERVTINVGPLMCIQVHSYQSKEIKDRTNSCIETEAGGLEHFDIDIYRNVDIIGGKAYEKIKLADLYGDELGKNNFIGFNEYSREEFINSFIENSSNIGELNNEKLAIEILYAASKVLYNQINNKDKIEKIKIVNNEKESIFI